MKHNCSLLLVMCGICLALTVTAQLPSYVPTNGLVSWWGFTGNANDYSGTGNHGTITGGVTLTTDRQGSPNKAYSFDGTGFISIFNCPTSGTEDFTISAWIQSPAFSNIINPIIIYGSHTINGHEVRFVLRNPEGYIYLNLHNVVAAHSSVPINDNQWHMVIGRNSNSTFDVFVDGVPSGAPYAVSTLNITPCENKFIGASKDESNVMSYYTGKLDDIGIWNRALSQGEITALFTGVGSSIEDATLPSPVSIYPNPASTRLNITLPNTSSGQANLALYNINGQLVMQSSHWNQSTMKLDVEAVPEGLYFLRIETEPGTATKKLVILRD